MEFGISTACFYPTYTEDAVRHLAENGIKLIEIFFNTYRELEKGYLEELKAVISAYGVRVVSVHPFTSGQEPVLFFSNYYRRFLDGLEQYKRYFNAINELGAKLLVFHGNFKNSSFPDTEYYDRFAKLRDLGAEYGVTVAQENVAPYKSGNLDFLARMQDYLDGQVKFVLDIKQTVRVGQEIGKMIDVLGKNIIHLHVSDHKEGFDCLPLGEGEFDFRWFFNRMKAVGFDGAAMVELYRHNYVEYQQLYDSLDYLKRL